MTKKVVWCVHEYDTHMSGIRKFDEHDSQHDYMVSMTSLSLMMMMIIILFVCFCLHAMRYIASIVMHCFALFKH